MLTIAKRTDGAVVVTALNEGTVPLRGWIRVCGIDRESLAEGQTPQGEFQRVKWGKLGARLLALEPGAMKTSLPLRVASGLTHVVAFGEGDNLQSCRCSLHAVGTPHGL